MIRHGRKRVVIEAVEPEIDGGRFPVKRAVGEDVTVEADVFIDGHDQLAAILQYRREGEPGWIEVPMTLLVNDRWRASFTVTKLGEYRFTVRAWVDRFGSWRRDLAKRIEAGQDVVWHREQGKVGRGEHLRWPGDRHPGQHPRGALHRGLGDRGHTGQVVPGPGERGAEGGPDPPGADDAHPKPRGMG